MANTIALRRRIKSVKSTRQITKAMELVSASKMRRAQDAALASREFTKSALEILSRLRQLTDVSKHPLYETRPVASKLYIVITSDRGLAGAYNSNVLKTFAKQLKSDHESGIATKALLVGKQAATFASRIKDVEVLGVYTHMPEKPVTTDLTPILRTAKEQFVGAPKIVSEDHDSDVEQSEPMLVDSVELIFTNFRSSLLQEVTQQTLLPAAFTPVELTNSMSEAIFEPSPEKVLQVITERFIEIQLLQAYLESQASEQSARMMAMKTASDNAAEIIDDLTLEANTARQSAITQELAEITGGAEAIK